MNSTEMIRELLGLYREVGSSYYIGEAVTQTQHALQAAKQAEQEGYDDEVILGAFFHDIGHVIGERQGLEKMVTGDVILGIQHHAERGGDYLESLGVTGNISKLVSMHVQAKRYLVATDILYYERLSEASKMTLEHQGGAMTDSEVLEFENNPLKDIIIKMRTWDEKAKVTNLFATSDETDAGMGTIEDRLSKYFGTDTK